MRVSFAALLLSGVAGCGGVVIGSAAPESFTVGGNLSGLAAGTSVVLSDSGSAPTALSVNGAFTFAVRVPLNGSYSVAVVSQPTGQTCLVGHATGAGVTANVNDVNVTCSANSFVLSGLASGLVTAQTVTLANGSDSVVVSGNGPFSFPTPIAEGGSYAVVVSNPAPNETCTLSSASGSNVRADIGSVVLSCSVDDYTISGTIIGLASGHQLTLQDNGADPVTVVGGGTGMDTFVFATPVAYQGNYEVTVGGQPAGQFCTVAGGSGSGLVANVDGVVVTCIIAWYVSGTGVDTQDGMTPATAFRTLNKAAGTVQPGQVVLAMNGVYSNDGSSSVLKIGNAGRPDAWVTFEAYPGSTPIIHTDGVWYGVYFMPASQYVEFSGFTIVGNTASLTLAGAQAAAQTGQLGPLYNGACIAQGGKTAPFPHHLRVLNNTIYGCPAGGIGFGSADYVTVSGNTVYNNSYYSPSGSSGISLGTTYDSDPADVTTMYKMVVTNNIVYGNQEFIPWMTSGQTPPYVLSDGEGIIIDSNRNHSYDANVPYPSYSGRTLIANNVVYANGSSAISVFESAHVDVVNNSTFGDIISPLGISASLGMNLNGHGEMNLAYSNDVNIVNNIFVSRSDENPLTQKSTCTGCSVDYNIYYGGTNLWGSNGKNGPHDQVVDPLYQNADTSSPAAVDLQLRTGSPAIGAGTSLLAPSQDINGNPRPSASGYSIGAYSE